ncbi:MAG: type IV secretory system conjugative DNA transfer family protein [Flavobacteriales bacterium]|nr:type IV secretory system conjugative DNA transfer family protein [Flavobacteriales bacterium]
MDYLYAYTPKLWHLAVLFIGIALVVELTKEKRKQDYDDNLLNPFRLIKPWLTGFYIGSGRISREHSRMHALVIGNTGSGKTVSTLLPSAIKFGSEDCSMIFLDPAREGHTKSSGQWAKHGAEVMVFSPNDHRISEGFNPIELANTSTEINMLAEMLMARQMKASKDIFWPSAASIGLSIETRLLKCLPKIYHNPVNLKRLNDELMSGTKVDKLCVLYGDDRLYSDYKAFIAQDPKVLKNILSSIQSALKAFADDELALCTSVNTIDFSAFRKQKKALYIFTDVMSDYHSFIYEMLFTFMFRAFMKEMPKDGDLPINILADEMGSFTVKGFPEALANLRKYDVSAMSCIQTLSQLEERYGQHDANTIKNNCWSKLIFPGMEMSLATELEQRLGKWSFERKDGKGRGQREILTRSELIHLEKSEAMLVAGSHRPAKVKVKPYFKDRSMRKISELPPAPFKGKVPSELNLMDIDQLIAAKKQHVMEHA